MYKLVLFYKYTPIADPEKLKQDQFELCRKLGIKGRILIADEGINGTAGGSHEAIEEYIKETSKIKGFEDIDFKITESEEDPFPRLRIVVRDEIVTLGIKKTGKDVPIAKAADYIEPEDMAKVLESGEEVYILDARNEYEHRIGKFKNAITLDIKNFRDLPEEAKKIEYLKDKPVITYCTGGIRCEKASAFLRDNGFKNVRQLHGGIQRYYDKTGGKDFEGEMYVFDNRIHVGVNDINPSIISECEHCHKKVARFINCCNAVCNRQFICCEECEVKMEKGCSEECRQNSRFKDQAAS